jgi:hypothetical protein
MPTIAPDRTVSKYAETFAKVEELQAEAQRLLVQIDGIYQQIGTVASKKVTSRGRPRIARTTRNGAGRAPRGALKAAIRKILSGKPCRPAEIVKKLAQIGYKTVSNPRVFYTNVYLTMKRDPAIKKTKEGFQLRNGKK